MRFRAARLVVCALACLSRPPAALCQDAAPAQLLGKAHTLESRGRLDMARQVWQQILLVEPNNPEALAGMARSAKLQGHDAEASQYLTRLQTVDPANPNLARIRNLRAAAQDNSALLQQAGQLANQGQYPRAAALLRQAYGDNPPPGDAALSYFQIEAAVDDLRPHAIAGLRAFADQYPDDPRYQIALGRILTWNPRTRAEGRKLLARHTTDPDASEALRQAQRWDRGAPSVSAETRAALARHPAPAAPSRHAAPAAPPTELAAAPPPTQPAPPPPAARVPEQHAAAEPRPAPHTPVGPLPVPHPPASTARATVVSLTPARSQASTVAAAYAALNARRFAEAEQGFQALLASNPAHAQALAGMGYVRMGQGNFTAAISFLSAAETAGLRSAALARALRDARFFGAMHTATQALAQDDVNLAVAQFRSAVQMRPSDATALEGLAGALLRAGQPERAIPLYATYLRLHSTSRAAWKGLFLAYAAADRPEFALATDARMPAAPHAALMADPVYLRTLAAAYTATHHPAEAQRVLADALKLPFPADARGLRADVQMQYAALLDAAGRHDQAAGLFRQVLASNPESADAWIGLIAADHAMGNNADAMAQLQSMPPAVFQRAMQQPGFASTVASIYIAQNREDLAQSTLESLLAQQQAAHQRPSLAAQVTLASLLLKHGDTVHAFPLFQAILSANPNRADAWNGLFTSLHATGHNPEALAELGQVPASVRSQLEKDPDFLQTVGSVYAELGHPQDAMRFLNRARLYYTAAHLPVPPGIDLQTAWLLYNTGDDPALYRQLMTLGGRPDLTDAQRRDVQTIWATWAVRRSEQSLAAGNSARALSILNAAARAFPGNPAVQRALATGYTAAGQPRQAVQLFRAQDLSHGSAADYRAAVTAALAARDWKRAETWLRFGLDQYPRDAQLLSLAAKYETARGHPGRAAEFYRASLKAMPAPDPGAELAAEMARAAPPARLPLAQANGDLASLLAEPEKHPAAPARPYLPSYSGSAAQAPVLSGPAQPSAAPPFVQPSAVQPPADALPGGVAPPVVLPPPGAAGASGVPGGSFANPSAATTRSGAPPATTLGQYVPQSFRGPRLSPYPFSRTIRFAAEPPPAQRLVTITWRPQTSAPQTPTPAAEDNPLARFGLRPPPQVSPEHPPAAPRRARPSARTTRRPVPRRAYPPRRASVPPRLPAARVTIPGVTLGAAAPPRFAPPAPPRAARPLPSARDRAAAIRANQANAPLVIEGTAHPPVEDYSTEAAAPSGRISSAQYTSAPRTAATPPAGQVVQPPPDAGAATFGQQYPQPSRRPGTESARPPARSAPSHPRRRLPPNPTPLPGTSSTTTTTTTSTTSTTTTTTTSRTARRSAAPLPYPVYPQQTAPPAEPPPQPAPEAQPEAAPGGIFPLPPPPSDEQLRLRNVPPLHGYFDSRVAPGAPLSARQQAELDLALLEASYSPWLGVSAVASRRSGTAGLDRLQTLSAPVEFTFALGTAARLSVVPEAVFLNSGQLVLPDVPHNTPLLGTLYDSSSGAPPVQSAAGIGGELQLATQTFQAAAGYTPYGFPVAHVLGRALWRPAGWHFTLFGSRDPMRETMLSYAGLHDPGSDDGVVWGGVVSSGGGLRFDIGDEHAGIYLQTEAAQLTGRNVLANRRYDGTFGAYFRLHNWPEYGTLNLGGMVFGEHFRVNERGETFGLGGYFSPSAFFLAAVPVTFNGHWQRNLHYTLNGSIGVQTAQEDSQIFFPLDRNQQALVPRSACTPVCGLQATSTTGVNYAFDAEVSYHLNDHWYIGAFLNGNNASNFNTASAGGFARFLFRPQVQTDLYPTGLFPVEGTRPVRVP